MKTVISFACAVCFVALASSLAKAQLSAEINSVKSWSDYKEPLEPRTIPMALVEAGTPIYLVTHNEFSTKYIKTGMTICLYLKFPVKVEGYKVIPSGTPAYCKVTQADKPHGNGRAGYIEIEPLYIKVSPDEVLPLTGNPLVSMGRDREALGMIVAQGGMAAAGLMNQAQGMIDTKKEKRRAMQQQQGYQEAQQQAMAMGFSNIKLAQPATSQAVQGPGGLSQVAQTLNIVAPLVGLLIRGKHAVIPQGYILNAYAGADTWVEMKD